MANDVEAAKPRLVKASAPEHFEADKAAAFSTADGRKLRSGQDRMRALEEANSALQREMLNLELEFAERKEQLTLAHAAHVARIMTGG